MTDSFTADRLARLNLMWLPIETAPKDGTWILLFGRHSRRGETAQIVCRWDGSEWQSSDDGYGAYIDPSNWMPLPAPPNE